MKTEDPIPEKPKKIQTKYNLSDYAKYTSLAFEMVIIMVAGVFGGRFFDRFFELHFPVFTLLLSLISVGLAIYFAIKDFIHPK
jgi:ATP synthase protein I